MTTVGLPQLHSDDDEPREQTVGYFRGGAPEFALVQARPAGSEARRLEQDLAEMAERAERYLDLAQQANRDASAALARETEALNRADDAETRLEVAQALIARLQTERWPMSPSEIAWSERAATLNPDVESWIRRALAASRSDPARKLVVVRQFIALADLVDTLLKAERAVDAAERANRPVTYAQICACDDAMRALARAVR